MRGKHFMVAVVAAGALAFAWATPALAQRGHGSRGGGHTTVVVRGYSGYPFYYYDPFYYSFWYPGPFYRGYPPYGPYAAGYDPGASVRLQVTPRDAEVFVDGYRAGIVDDFDGTFQRLRVRPGPHEIVLYKDGFRTVRQSVHLQPDSTYNVRFTMVQLAPGDQTDPRPIPPPEPPPSTGGFSVGVAPPAPARGQQPPPMHEGNTTARYGAVSMRIQPADAEVLIDGESWRGPEGAPLVVQLSAGAHRVEVRRDGYQPFATTIQIRPNDTATLNVSLPAERR